MLTYEDIRCRLHAVYDAREAQAVARLLLDEGYGLTLADLLSGKLAELSDDVLTRVEADVRRLEQGEPVQYVLGRADFCGRSFRVAPGVLIPRPETEELCRWILSESREAPAVLDIGTGSGCIACTLAAEMPLAQVTAWDLSTTALAVAASNAKRTGVNVSFRQQDALLPPADESLWDIVVSNPPYICERERASMHRNVLDYEPSEALFVADDDPLQFYRAIGRYALKALRPGGMLFFEINAAYGQQLSDLLLSQGFGGVELRHDQFGLPRFIKVFRP